VIRHAIVNGKIDKAIRSIDTYFPGVLEEEGRGKELQLWLKCGRFVEMMREYCEYNENGGTTRSRSSSSGDIGLDAHKFVEPPTPSSPKSIPKVGRRLSYAAMAASLSPSNSTEMIPKLSTPTHEDADMMDIDPVHPNHSSSSSNSNGNVWKRRTSACSANNSFAGLDSHSTMEDGNSNVSHEVADALKLVMQYGQKLQEEYRHDTQEKTRASLVVKLFT
jgi:hypothetical protein